MSCFQCQEATLLPERPFTMALILHSFECSEQPKNASKLYSVVQSDSTPWLPSPYQSASFSESQSRLSDMNQ